MELVIMIGLPGSGKSYYAKNEVGYDVVSSDSIREELYGDASEQGNPKVVFKEVYRRAEELLKHGKSAVIDATNICRKDRREAIAVGKRNGATICGLVMRTPISTCIERNGMRDRVVPIEVIHRMVSRFEYPLYEEGFDFISAIPYCDGEYDNMFDYLEKCKGFDQQNVHHTNDLYEHCAEAAKLAAEGGTNRIYSLSIAAIYHDVGKLFTQTGPDENGNCHYFGHANWSAYIFLCSNQFSAFACRLINYHMIPYLYEWNRFKKRFADEQGDFINLLEQLHNADMCAH